MTEILPMSGPVIPEIFARISKAHRIVRTTAAFLFLRFDMTVGATASPPRHGTGTVTSLAAVTTNAEQ